MSSGCAAAQDREHIEPERPSHSTRRLFLTLHVQNFALPVARVGLSIEPKHRVAPP